MRLPLTLIASALLLSASAPTPAVLAAGEPSVPLPFDTGEAVRIIQGYNGGTHQGASIYGLDLVLASGETSGAPVLAPFDGTIAWAFAPGDKTGCIEVVAKDRRYGAMLCHIVLDRPFTRGERVARGQQLGAVGGPGMVGNNGSAHVHMELHVGGRSSDIVPFSTSNGGLSLDGVDLPFTGGTNEHAGEGPILSTNALSAPPTMAPVAAPAAPVRPAGNRCAPGSKPRFSFGFASLKTQLGDILGDAASCEFPDPNGSGDVLQQTTRGLAFWRKSTNTPSFTNGNEHWALTTNGLVTWTGPSVDPPVAATASSD